MKRPHMVTALGHCLLTSRPPGAAHCVLAGFSLSFFIPPGPSTVHACSRTFLGNPVAACALPLTSAPMTFTVPTAPLPRLPYNLSGHAHSSLTSWPSAASPPGAPVPLGSALRCPAPHLNLGCFPVPPSGPPTKPAPLCPTRLAPLHFIPLSLYLPYPAPSVSLRPITPSCHIPQPSIPFYPPCSLPTIHPQLSYPHHTRYPPYFPTQHTIPRPPPPYHVHGSSQFSS